MILHITNSFSGSAIYKNLMSVLDNKGVTQIVYTPVKSAISIGKNKITLNVDESSLIYSNILNMHIDRVFYKCKINKILRDVEAKVDVNDIKCIHAHTWYSDGGVAYELYKKYHIPYIIAIRNTDLNLFWKLPYLKNYGLKILQNASKVILISEAYKNRLLSNETIANFIKDKCIVLPNGVDKFWLENSVEVRSINKADFINILYVGNFNSGKNVENLIKAVLLLDSKYGNVKLSLVGGSGSSHKRVIKLIDENPHILKYYGKVMDKDKLLSIYRNHQIFAMPSKGETFGLVYIEALLQGLPVLYTRGEGIDGLYGNEIGEAVDNSSVQEIEFKLTTLIENFDNCDFNIEEIKTNHNWKKIADKYINLYNTIKEDSNYNKKIIT